MPASRPAEERFWEKVDARGPCWEWTASLSKGYGQFWTGARTQMAHIWAWEFLVGPVAEGRELDHLCRNRVCVNPDHLDPVSHRENLLRGATRPRANVAKTHCPRGHEYSPANTRVYRGSRFCMTCARLRRAGLLAAR